MTPPLARRQLLLGTLGVLAGTACAHNPVTGGRDFVLISAERERELGREQAQEIARTMGLVEDAALTQYVAEIGGRLAVRSPRQDVTYEFHVADAPEPNAFALPGGPVYVTRGLLALVNREDELAAVLGHEIAHVAARHSVRRVSAAAPLAVLFGVPGRLLGVVSEPLGDVVGGLGQLGAGLVLAPYSRDQEREADRVGIELAARAGWDPGAMATFLTTLERDERRVAGQAARPRFLANHPSTPERVEDTAQHARGLARAAAAPIARDRAELLRRLDGLVVGPNAAQGVFRDDLFLHPRLGLALRFPGGWKTQNTASAVGAMEPEGRAVCVLQVAAAGGDPVAAARGDGLDERGTARLDRAPVNGLPAARLVSEGSRASADITWVAHGGTVYRVVGVAPRESFPAFRSALAAAGRSFRPITAAERAAVRHARLRARPAVAGESITQLVQRTGSAWGAAEAAIANGLPDGARLDAGALLKVPIAEPYAPPPG